jgi:hypothetical protein
MLSWIVYGVGSLILGLMLGLGWLTFFGHPSKADRPIFPVLAKSVIFGVAAPFLWCEGLTKMVGPRIEGLAEKAFESSEIRGPMRYYRVVTFSREQARLYVFGEEKDRGFTDHPVLMVQLKKAGDEWEIEDTQILVSDRLNKDMLVLPPYQ